MWYLRDKMSVKQPAPTTRRLSAALAESASSSANTSSSSSHIFMSPERQDWAYYHSTPSSKMSSPVSSRRGSLHHIHQQYDLLSNRRASLTTSPTKFENYTKTPLFLCPFPSSEMKNPEDFFFHIRAMCFQERDFASDGWLYCWERSEGCNSNPREQNPARGHTSVWDGTKI